MHTPVLLEETLKALDIKRNGLYIDATAGEGGHLKNILGAGGKVLAIDADYQQIENLNKELKKGENALLTAGNFRNIEEIAKGQDFFPVDGIVFDLGLSMRQINESGRGFSYNKPEEPLDMRLGREQIETASEIINSLDADQLYEIFTKNSEELDSRAIAEAIYSRRRLKTIETVGDLLEVLEGLRASNQTKARIFQALRIETNKEKENLEQGLKGGLELLKNGGRMAVISFHSLEDRWVKRFIQSNKEKIKEEDLIRAHKGARFERSAKLRIIIKK